MKPIVIALALFASMDTTSAAACHRFHVWKYPYPQRCDFRVAEKDPPPPPTKPIDQRTPEQIQEQVEHDAAMANHHEELKYKLEMLRQLRDALDDPWGMK